MNNIQEIIALLAPITLLIGAIAGLLAAIINLVEQIGELWSKLRPVFRLLLLTATQILPVGGTIWYFLYFAATNSERLTERAFFLLLVIYPTLIISSYEMFWGMVLYPKLLSVSRFIGPLLNKSKLVQKHRKGNKR